MEDNDDEQVLQNCPSLEEFTQLVKEDFKCWFTGITDAAVDRYFETDEARNEVEDRYNENVEELKSGEITTMIFRIDCVASVAMCLSLMYDGPLS